MSGFPAATQMSPLVGRERERAIVGERLALALGGHGGLILISGEAGIGKTALAEALCRAATEQGASVFVGRCYDLTETPPYGPWIELLEQGQLDDASLPVPGAFARDGRVAEAESQAEIFRHVLDFFATLTARQPVVLLLDDLHWADPASLDLLRVVARHVAQWPMLILALYRSEAVDANHRLYELLPAIVREAPTERLALRQLEQNDVRSLIDRCYALPSADAARLSRYVQRRGEGNPFYIGELLRELQDASVLQSVSSSWTLGSIHDVPVPALARQVIGVRIRRLGEDVQRLLAIAAIIGQDVPLAVWQAVAAVDVGTLLAAVEQAERAHIVAGARDGAGIRFAHALIRETLYEELSAARRRLWHQQVGDVLAASPGSDADAIAYHFAQAGDARAAAWLVRAGDTAQRVHAWVTAAERYEAALAHLGAADEHAALRARLHFRIAMMVQWNDPAHAIAHIDAVRQIAALREDHALLAHARWYRGIFRIFAGELDAGLGDLAAGVTALDALAPADAASRDELEDIATLPQGARRALAMHLARAGRTDEATMREREIQLTHGPTAENAVPTTQNVTPGRGITAALQGLPAEAQAAFAAARSLFPTPGVGAYSRGFVLINELRMVTLAYHTDDLARRRYLALESEHAWAQSFGITLDLRPRFAAVPLMLVEGQWSEAREIARNACESAAADMRVQAMSMLGPVARAQGDPALAWAQVRALFPDGAATRPGTVPFFDALILQRLASALAMDEGKTAEARAWLEMHDAWLAWSGSVLGRADGQVSWARYARAIGDGEASNRHARRALGDATEPRQPLALIAVHRLIGVLETDAGRHADATAHLDAALALADACAAPYERALTLLATAELAIATGDRPYARALLDEGRAICASLGAVPALRRADALLARLRNDAEAKSPYPDHLSAREADVLRLIARGMSNREIAGALFISSRTVNRHIENLYRKIGARNRADATAYALRHDLT